MKHPISYDEWLGYLDGALEEADAARVRRHIESCSDCESTWSDLLAATESLRTAARRFVEAHDGDAAAVRRGRERVLARIRGPQGAVALEAIVGGELTIGRLRRLQRVVAPVCGAQTAFRLIVESAGRTSVKDGAAAWGRFLDQLTELTSALCGRSTARLVLRIGSSLS